MFNIAYAIHDEVPYNIIKRDSSFHWMFLAESIGLPDSEPPLEGDAQTLLQAHKQCTQRIDAIHEIMRSCMTDADGSETVPNFVTPTNILQMNDEEIDALLEGIRVRRMIKLTIYSETMKEKELAGLARIEARLEKKSEQFLRQLASVDKALDKLEMVTNEIRGLRLQMGLDPM